MQDLRPGVYPGTVPTIYWNGANWPIIMGGAPDGDGNSGDGDGTSTDNDGGTSTDQDGGKSENEKLFTQDQLNAIATREAQKAARGKLDPKELGFDSVKDMKDWVDSQRKLSDEQKTEDEKAREEAIKAAQDQARTEVLSKADERIRKAEFLVQAVDHGIRREARDDAYLLAPTLEAWTSVEVGEDGNVAGFDDTFFEELKEKKPFLFEPEKSDNDGGSGGDIGAGRRGSGPLEPGEADLKQKYSALR